METMRKFTASLSGLATVVVAGLLLSACGDRTKPMPTAAEPAPRSAAAKTTAQPAAPTNFRAATVKTQVITLTWDAGAGAAGYKVQKRRASWNEWENAQCKENDADKIVSGTTCTAVGLKPATEFRFRVRSWASSGVKEDASAWVELASPVSTYPRLSAPTAVSGSATAGQEITVTWTAAADESARVVGYRVQRQQAGKSFWKLAGCTESGGESLVTSGTTCTVSGLKTGVAYRFRVKAHGDAGHAQTHSEWSQLSGLITADIISFADANLERVVRYALRLEDSTVPLTLKDVASLTQLDGRSQGIQSLAGLGHCTALQSLLLTGNQISDVSALATLTKLTELYLAGNQISDVSALASLTNLTGLYLADNQISDVSGLATLTKLTHLDLTDNQLTDVSGLATLTKLTHLYLDSNQLTDVSGLATLTKLTHLELDSNQLTDVSGLATLTKLQTLNLAGNQLTDVSGLATLTKLQTLNLNSNQISDVSGLATLTNLQGVTLGGNQISDVSGLATLTSLTHLVLNDNQISDVSALASLTNLQLLLLQDNSLSDQSLTVHIPAMLANGTIVLY